jgi:uncharacterized membrane protein YwzB
MQKIPRLLAVLSAEALAVIVALAICQAWLIQAVDDHSWLYREGEPHDYLPPGEWRLLIIVHVLSVALAVWLGLRCLRLKCSISRKAAVSLAIPAAIIGIVLFETFLSRFLPDTMTTSAYGVFPLLTGGVIVGSLGP